MKYREPGRGKYVSFELPSGTAITYEKVHELGRELKTLIGSSVPINFIYGKTNVLEFFWDERYAYEKIRAGIEEFLRYNPEVKLNFTEVPDIVL